MGSAVAYHRWPGTNDANGTAGLDCMLMVGFHARRHDVFPVAAIVTYVNGA
jgi:hypothetical protein